MSQPNTGNPAFFGQKVSKPGVNVLKAAPTDLIYSNDYTTTTYYDGSNARILLGQLPDNTYGMWVSKPGNDVSGANAVANNQLIFNSNAQVFLVALTGSMKVTVSGLSGDPTDYTVQNFFTSVPHGLGYTPLVFGFQTGSATGFGISTGTSSLPYRAYTGGYVGVAVGNPVTGTISIPLIGLDVQISTDSVNVIISMEVQNAQTNFQGTYDFNYYLLRNSATQ